MWTASRSGKRKTTSAASWISRSAALEPQGLSENAVAAGFLADAAPGWAAAEHSAERAALNPQSIRPLHRDIGVVGPAAVGIMNLTDPFCIGGPHVDENFLAGLHCISAKV